MTEAVRKIKRSSASLKGGIIVGITVVVLSLLVTGELEWGVVPQWVTSIAIGAVMGVWVRIADL